MLDFVLETFFGQLQHIFIVKIPAVPQLVVGVSNPKILILGAIITCEIKEKTDLDMHYYKKHRRTEVVDFSMVQCLVGQVKDWGFWTIIDWSGNLARATFNLD